MVLFNIDIAHIVELGTQIANAGAIKALEVSSDGVFEYLVGVAVLVYEQDPD